MTVAGLGDPAPALSASRGSLAWYQTQMLQAGSMWDRHRGEGDMTGKTGMTNRKRTSGYAHCAKTGNGRSIEPIDKIITP